MLYMPTLTEPCVRASIHSAIYVKWDGHISLEQLFHTSENVKAVHVYKCPLKHGRAGRVNQQLRWPAGYSTEARGYSPSAAGSPLTP